MRILRLFSLAMLATLLFGCASTETGDKKKVEKGPNGTIAYYVEVETSEPGARIEADGNEVGTSPLKLKVFGDKDGTFHNFGRYQYVVSAYPVKPGQFVQTKVFKTGGWFTPEDRIPTRIYFDLNLVPTSAMPAPGASAPVPSLPQGAKASGTGFFVTEDGYILSNAHVVEGAQSVKVKVGGEMHLAEIVRKDQGTDLAILKIKGKFPALPLGDSRKVKMGERVYTLGFPKIPLQGQEPKFTEGNISSLTGFQDSAGEFQISVPIQLGNSGGPLVNAQGEVIGIIVAKLRGGENVNYAVKSSRARLLLDEVLDLRLMESNPKGEQRPEDIADKLKASTAMILVY